MKCYVVGDIHGCLDELARLLENLPLEQSDRVVFLGDYVDRGPDSKEVVSYLIAEVLCTQVRWLKLPKVPEREV